MHFLSLFHTQALQALGGPGEDEYEEGQFGSFRTPIDERSADGMELIELHRVLGGTWGKGWIQASYLGFLRLSFSHYLAPSFVLSPFLFMFEGCNYLVCHTHTLPLPLSPSLSTELQQRDPPAYSHLFSALLPEQHAAIDALRTQAEQLLAARRSEELARQGGYDFGGCQIPSSFSFGGKQ